MIAGYTVMGVNDLSNFLRGRRGDIKDGDTTVCSASYSTSDFGTRSQATLKLAARLTRYRNAIDSALVLVVDKVVHSIL